jgi:hypothetical protein
VLWQHILIRNTSLRALSHEERESSRDSAKPRSRR